MAQTVSECSTCSPNGDTVKNTCIPFLIPYLLYLGQRKRERLQSLETRLRSGMGDTDAGYASGRGIQLQHPTQPPLLRQGNPGSMPIGPVYDVCQNPIIGTYNTTCMCFGPHDLASSASENSPFVRDQFDFNANMPYGTCCTNSKLTHHAVTVLTSLVCRLFFSKCYVNV